MQINFVLKIVLRVFWAFIFLGVLSIALAFAIFLYPDLLAFLVALAMIIFGIVLISLAFWIRKYAKVNLKL
ncbi:hypothetical protein HQ544_05160 [Candidatus Falkowbacteria bacterium]|nr:hypothetical protein [Candidatus Falkowbacteria bacterium]